MLDFFKYNMESHSVKDDLEVTSRCSRENETNTVIERMLNDDDFDMQMYIEKRRLAMKKELAIREKISTIFAKKEQVDNTVRDLQEKDPVLFAYIRELEKLSLTLYCEKCRSVKTL